MILMPKLNKFGLGLVSSVLDSSDKYGLISSYVLQICVNVFQNDG